MSSNVTPERPGARDSVAAEQVIAHVCGLIERRTLRPGDRLASERELARQVGVSRPSVRAGLRSLAAMHGLHLGGLWEVRRVLEAGTASLAAERATSEQIATLSDEVTGMYSALHDPHTFLDYDLRFHRAVAAGANNPMLGAIIEAVTALFFEERRVTIERARNLRESADAHRKIYQAIRARDADGARIAMDEHIRVAALTLAKEEAI